MSVLKLSTTKLSAGRSALYHCIIGDKIGHLMQQKQSDLSSLHIFYFKLFNQDLYLEKIITL